MNGEQFPQRLRRMRTRRRMTQEILADFCEVCVNAIATYESGKHMPTVKSLCRMADFFEVSVDYLLCRTDDPRLERD